MTGILEAAKGAFALIVGGVMFTLIGSTTTVLNTQLFALLYFGGAAVLIAGIVYAGLRAAGV